MLQRAITVPLPGPRGNAKQYLEKYGFKPPKSPYEQVGVAIGLLLLGPMILFGLWWLLQKLPVPPEPNSLDLDVASMMLVGIALATLAIGYRQWRDARHEVSLDKYYERLDLANKRQDGTHTEVHQMMRPCLPELAGESHEVLMYVYVELDNLEYVIEKYSLGYMTEKHACRGLKTFQLRCWSEQFRRIARHRVHVGDYKHRTAVVVDRVCDKIEELIARQHQHAAELVADRRHTVRRASDLLYLASGFQTRRQDRGPDPAQPGQEGSTLWFEVQEEQVTHTETFSSSRRASNSLQ